jgi:acetylornithine deacetylase
MLSKFYANYRDLISFNTISSEIITNDKSNEECIDYLISELELMNFKCSKIKVNNSNNKYNLIAKYGDGIGGIAFSGHTDTVPANNELWTFPPHSLTEHDGKLYGLGTIDMKGYFAFILEALRRSNLSQATKPIYVFATADEETTMNGAIELSNTCTEKPNLIVIGEPTSLIPVIMHKGHLVQQINIKGVGGHSSNPEKGLNAILIANEIILKLNELKEYLKANFIENLFPVNYPTLNIGIIEGGKAPNVICDNCIIQFDIRAIPTLTNQQLINITKDFLSPLFNKYRDNISITYPYSGVEPFSCKEHHEIVNTVETITKTEAIAVNYCTEATYLQNIAPTVILGPGSIDMAHQPNEYLDKKEIEPGINIYKELISTFSI